MNVIICNSPSTNSQHYLCSYFLFNCNRVHWNKHNKFWVILKIETINMAYEVLYFDMPLCLNRRLPQNTNTHQSVAAFNCVNFIPDQDEDAVWPGIKKLPSPDLIPVHCDQSDGLSVTESLQSSNFSDEIDLIDAFKEVNAYWLKQNQKILQESWEHYPWPTNYLES